MTKRITAIVMIALLFCMVLASVSCAVEKETVGMKMKNFWQKLFNYPANVTGESAKVVADTGIKSVDVVTKEVKTVGQVTSGDVKKTGDLVTEPIKGTADTAVSAVKGTANVPTAAAKEEPASPASN